MEKKSNIKKILDKTTFEELFKSHFKPLCGFANKYLKDIDSSKEIVHSVFVNLWENRHKIDLNKPVKSYLYTSVNNRSLNFIRDNKKFVSNEYITDDNYKEQNWNLSNNLIEIELQEKINQTLDSLPAKCKKVFMLSRYEQMKYKEIAKHLDISIKTVETHISRALKELRIHLSEYLTILLILLWIN